MHTSLIFALVSLSMLSAGFHVSASRVQADQTHADARVKLDAYRQFVFAAVQYMASSQPAGLPRRVTWQEIRSAPGPPPGAARAGVPAGWRLEVAADGNWVTCTELPEAGVTAIGQWLPVSQSGAGFVVAGAVTAAEAAAMAQRCAL